MNRVKDAILKMIDDQGVQCDVFGKPHDKSNILQYFCYFHDAFLFPIWWRNIKCILISL